MTGSEHYLQAEQHAREAAQTFDTEPALSAWLLGRAQVHATLALAAATAAAADGEDPSAINWLRVTS